MKAILQRPDTGTIVLSLTVAVLFGTILRSPCSDVGPPVIAPASQPGRGAIA
jgi:hypothetical protein